jgi:hypothetical protein
MLHFSPCMPGAHAACKTCASQQTCSEVLLQRACCCRYGVEHPLVVDQRMEMGRALGISSWPSFVVLSPVGRVLKLMVGEDSVHGLGDFVAAALEHYAEACKLAAQVPEVRSALQLVCAAAS